MGQSSNWMWQGQSSAQYTYQSIPIARAWALPQSPGNYIFAQEFGNDTGGTSARARYIGETSNLYERLYLNPHEKRPCVNRHGATHIHYHTSSAIKSQRTSEETDLIRSWKPVCND